MVKADKLNLDAQKPSDQTQFITVFTDASFCPNTKAYGGAFWIRHPKSDKPETCSFGGKNAGNTVINAEHAELLALENALKRITELYDDLSEIVIVIQSDCLGALNKLNVSSISSAKFLKLKHVKAHTNSGTKRSVVNSMVDRLAYKKMAKYRKDIQWGKK